MALPFSGVSVLDRAQSRAGSSEADALAHVVERARSAERLDYRRFWVAEHHGVPGIAGSVPAVLAAAIASRTTSIRIGTGGIMLPNHQPLVVAEEAATLSALSDGRFDLGIGRSLGFTEPVRSALRAGKEDAARFEEDLTELLAFLTGGAPITARPQDGGRTPVFVLATGQGVDIAARSGLGVVLGGPGLFRADDPALERYRADFRPSAWWDAPHVTVSLDVAVASTTEKARALLLPQAHALAVSRTKGYFPPLEEVTPEQVHTRDQVLMEKSLATSVFGTPREVEQQLTELQARTGADELLVTGGAWDLEAQGRSDELLAELAVQ